MKPNMESAINGNTQRSHDLRWVDRLPIKNVDEASSFAQTIVDAICDPLLVLDQKLRVVTANRSFYQTFSMAPQITTELVINALKPGFPIRADGCEILVRYDVDECNWRLSVSDNGIGMQRDGGARGRTGLGAIIVEALAHQLKACVEISRLSPGMIVSIVHTAHQAP
jgi:signal transduction histidine kinase